MPIHSANFAGAPMPFMPVNLTSIKPPAGTEELDARTTGPITTAVGFEVAVEVGNDTGMRVGCGVGGLVVVAVGDEIGTFVGNTGEGRGKVGIAVDVIVGTGVCVIVGLGITVGSGVALGAGMTVAIGNGEVVWAEVGGGADTGTLTGRDSMLTPIANTENPGVMAT